MLIYSQHITKRLEYTLDFFFNQLIGIDYYITDDKKSFVESATQSKICYNSINLGGIHIVPIGLVFEDNIKELNVESVKWEEQIAIFPSQGDIPFDLFSAVFFLISRYEEYLPSDKDEHNRFQSKNSITAKYDFLHRPIINEWAEKFKLIYSLKSESKNEYQSIITFDIDTAYAFKGKGLKRIIGGMIKDFISLKFTQLNKKIKTNINSDIDPYNYFSYIFNSLRKYDARNVIFFFLNGKYGEYDKNLRLDSKLQIDTITRCSENGEIGIHPSYSSNTTYKELKNEIQSLEAIIEKPIIKSRQHFLMLQLPKTYQNLIKNDILQDFTLGYAENLGFRASTCTPFYWFDLSNNRKTTLKLYPVGIMDGTLMVYLKLGLNEAITEAKKHIDYFKKYNGTFVLLWHNSSFNKKDGWEGWEKVYEEILAYSK